MEQRTDELHLRLHRLLQELLPQQKDFFFCLRLELLKEKRQTRRMQESDKIKKARL